MVDKLKINKTDKWYDSPELVGAMLLFLLPMGFYALAGACRVVDFSHLT